MPWNKPNGGGPRGQRPSGGQPDLEELLKRTKDITPAGDIDYVRDAYSRGVYQLPVTITPK